MSYKVGNLIELAQKGHFDLIAHGANCFCTFGAGIAKAIKNTFPEAYKKDLETVKGDYKKLGHFSLAEISLESGGRLAVANLYTQYYWGKANTTNDTKDVRYKAIEDSLLRLKKITNKDSRIGLPKLGAGLAMGKWEVIEKIISDILPQATIVELPKNNIGKVLHI